MDWAAEAAAFAEALTSDGRASLAASLSVTAEALTALGCGWADEGALRRLRASGEGWRGNYPPAAYVFPERNAAGRIVGLSLRAADGRKGAPAGVSRGLIVPASLKQVADPVLIVEGASDVAACVTLGLAAVGRPSNTGGADDVANLLEGRRPLVVAERDQKSDGAWPGRDGARRVAERLATEWNEDVEWCLPPEGAKDVRAWLVERVKGGLDLANPAACKAAGTELLTALTAAVRTQKAERRRGPTEAELLVQLAEDRFRIGRTVADDPFAVRREGPNVAFLLRGTTDSVRALLAREFRAAHQRTPSAAALADALVTLQGMALDAEAERVELRVAEMEDAEGRALVLDLGGPDGRAVVIRQSGWEVVEPSPVLFRRTALTAALPEPVRGGSLDTLRDLLNVDDDSWWLSVGWLLAAFFPNIAHPILMIGGLQGTGKSMAAGFLFGLFDPSAVANHNVPRDPESWAMAASGSWGVFVDNISEIPEWWADMLCKTVTGTAWVRRKLYSDSGLSILDFRRVVGLTSIDAGDLRGDLADRMLILDLERIDDAQRRDEEELRVVYARHRPAMLGALLDLLVKVLAAMPEVTLANKPRMADFARVLASMDRVLGTDSVRAYRGQRGRIAEDVIASDPVGEAVADFVRREGDWSGTANELLQRITPEGRKPDQWPKSGKGMGGRLRRLAPALRLLDIDVVPPKRTDKTRRYVLRPIARIARPPERGHGELESKVEDRAIGLPVKDNRPTNRPTLEGGGHPEKADLGRLGGSGDPAHTFPGVVTALDPGNLDGEVVL